MYTRQGGGEEKNILISLLLPAAPWHSTGLRIECYCVSILDCLWVGGCMACTCREAWPVWGMRARIRHAVMEITSIMVWVCVGVCVCVCVYVCVCLCMCAISVLGACPHCAACQHALQTPQCNTFARQTVQISITKLLRLVVNNN